MSVSLVLVYFNLQICFDLFLSSFLSPLFISFNFLCTIPEVQKHPLFDSSVFILHLLFFEIWWNFEEFTDSLLPPKLMWRYYPTSLSETLSLALELNSNRRVCMVWLVSCSWWSTMKKIHPKQMLFLPSETQITDILKTDWHPA